MAPSALALGLPGFRLPSEPHSGSGTFSGPLSSYQVLKLEVLECRNRKRHSSSAKWLAVLKKLSIRYRPTRQPCPWALDPEQVTQTPGRTQSSSTLRQIPDLGQAQMSLHREVADPAVVRPTTGHWSATHQPRGTADCVRDAGLERLRVRDAWLWWHCRNDGWQSGAHGRGRGFKGSGRSGVLAASRGDVRGPRSARCLESMSSRDHRGRWVTKGAWSSAFHSLKLHGPTRTLKLSV